MTELAEEMRGWPCLICDAVKLLGEDRVPHPNQMHFAVGWDGPFEIEVLIEPYASEETQSEYGLWADKNYPWTLESIVDYWKSKGYTIVSMSKRRKF